MNIVNNHTSPVCLAYLQIHSCGRSLTDNYDVATDLSSTPPLKPENLMVVMVSKLRPRPSLSRHQINRDYLNLLHMPVCLSKTHAFCAGLMPASVLGEGQMEA